MAPVLAASEWESAPAPAALASGSVSAALGSVSAASVRAWVPVAERSRLPE
ncbi:MAG TPA: hypothetical protein VKE51_03730 [Vicinamibacterales bacterium]|nr:hypothetical protein [Vicinamibacterales bacterium]